MQKQKIRILFINIKYSQGGAAIIAKSLFEELKSDYITSFIYGYGKGGNPDNNATLPEIKMSASKITFALNKISYNLFGRNYFTSGKKEIRQMIQNSDIIHLHAIHSHFINEEFLINTILKYNKSIIWTFHDSWVFTGRCALPYYCKGFLSECRICEIKENYPSTVVANNKNNFLRKKKLFERIPSDKLTIVCPSEWLAETSKKTFLDRFKILTIPNGIALDKFSFQQKRLTNDTKLSILFIANYINDTIKGADFFFCIVKEFPEVNFNAIGYYDDKCPQFPNLKYHGYISDTSKLIEHFNSNHLTVFFSKYDNYPTVIVESLAVGTPVLSFKGKGNQEIFKQMKYPYLINDDDFDAACQIIKSFKNPESQAEFERVSFEGRIQVEKYNKLHIMNDQYSLLIQKIVNDNLNYNSNFK